MYVLSVQTHKKRLTAWSRTWCSLSTLDLKIWILQLTLFFLFRLPLMPEPFCPLALYVFQSHKGSHIQTAGAIVLFWFFHFEVYNLRFDFCKIALPHDRFKLSTLVHLEGPLTLLLATVICISLKCDARAVAGGESQPYVVIANWGLSNFTEVVSRYTLPSLLQQIGLSKSWRTFGSARTQGSLSAGVIRFSMSLHRQRDQIITSVGGRRTVFRSFTL